MSPAIKYPRAVIIITSSSKSMTAITERHVQQNENYLEVPTHPRRKDMKEVLKGPSLCVSMLWGLFPQIQMLLPLPNVKKPWIRGTLKNVENR